MKRLLSILSAVAICCSTLGFAKANAMPLATTQIDPVSDVTSVAFRRGFYGYRDFY